MNTEDTKKLKVGMKVKVKEDAVWYDYSAGPYSTLVEGVARPHHCRGHHITIQGIYDDGMEDTEGNPINEVAIDTTWGLFSPEQLEFIE